MFQLPDATTLLLAIAVILALLAVRGYLHERKLSAAHRTWLTVAAIFVIVSIGVKLLT